MLMLSSLDIDIHGHGWVLFHSVCPAYPCQRKSEGHMAHLAVAVSTHLSCPQADSLLRKDLHAPHPLATLSSSREKPKHTSRDGTTMGFCRTTGTLWSTSCTINNKAMFTSILCLSWGFIHFFNFLCYRKNSLVKQRLIHLLLLPSSVNIHNFSSVSYNKATFLAFFCLFYKTF